jgi:hypothetical protein
MPCCASSDPPFASLLCPPPPTGHWIQLCPTNDDKEFDNKPRFKRTTGIPRSFLKTVDGPVPADGPMGGVMITPEGGFVIAQPDMCAQDPPLPRPHARVDSLTACLCFRI